MLYRLQVEVSAFLSVFAVIWRNYHTVSVSEIYSLY